MNNAHRKIRLLVDGMFFQLSNSGIARVWKSMLEILSTRDDLEIFFLDRGNTPGIENIYFIPFPDCHLTDAFAVHSSAESEVIQQLCDFYQIDVFTSSYYSVPLRTPMLLMVYDMIPELFDYDMSYRIWMEKEAAISYAQRYICISECTKNDLLALYPEIPASAISVAHCGVDQRVFHPASEDERDKFRKDYQLNRPYFIFVGSRIQHNGYKNSGLFFNALSRMNTADFDVFCVGGEAEIEAEVLDSIPKGIKITRVELSDEELCIAYSGAIALIYPSLYEGFGMPVIEAMSSGCPVITTHNGSLAEAAGDAACLISGNSVDEMSESLIKIQDKEYRKTLKEKGISHAATFHWDNMADVFIKEIKQLLTEHKSGKYKIFQDEWEKLRKIQAAVDY